MRPLLFLACLALAVEGVGQVLINEVQCARTRGTDGKGPNGDWVEFFNAGNQPVDLGGYLLAQGLRVERIGPGTVVAPGGHKVLWCGKDDGPDRLAMRLPKEGGALLLVAPDGVKVLDLFRWPALLPGVSMGRMPDGDRDHEFMQHPTPGMPNKDGSPRLLPPPVLVERDGRVYMEVPQGAEVRYTTDGAEPDEQAMPYRGGIEVGPGMVLRAKAFAKDAVPGMEAVLTPSMADTAWALVVDPDDLLGPLGIADTAHGNYARRGSEWHRQAWAGQGSGMIPVGLSIAGGGSRSLPKKNFKLAVRNRFNGNAPIGLPNGTHWKRVLLRADASPHAFLRNLFVEETVGRSGQRVDVQPSSAVPLFLNGVFHGAYRVMPAKGNEWLRRRNGGGAVEIVEGPAALPVKGSVKGYLRALEALGAGVRMDSLERLIDTESLTELACLDLWMGRADHELNVRAWRSDSPGGRWRWVMYDMDMWAPPEDHTVQRMTGAILPEAPFLSEILAHPGMEQRLLARLSALCATTLSPERAMPLLDSLFARHRHLLELDYRQWRQVMPMDAPAVSAELVKRHVSRRPALLLKQMADRVGRPLLDVSVQVEPAGSGQVQLEGLFLTDHRGSAQVFAGIPLHLRAVPAEGMEFIGWKGGGTDRPELAITPDGHRRLVALFRPSGLSGHGRLKQGLKEQTPVGISQ